MQTTAHPPRLIRGALRAALPLAFCGLLVSAINAGTSSPNTRTIETFPLGAPANGMAYDGANIWVALTNNTVAKVASDGTILAVFPVGRSPQYLVFDGTYMWVTNFSSDTVTARRATDGFRLGTFAVGSNPSGVTFDG